MNRITIMIVIIVLLFLSVAIPKIYISYKLKNYFNSTNFEEYQKFLQSKLVKLFVRPINVEMNKLVGYMASNDDIKTEKQLEYMFKEIKMFEKQRTVLAQRAFYFYLKTEDFKKCKEMVNIISSAKTKPSDFDTMITIVDIFVDNKYNHIEELEEKIDVLKQKSIRSKQIQLNTGIYEYMIAYQYMNKKDYKKEKEYLNRAIDKCRNTPYERKIKEMLNKID